MSYEDQQGLGMLVLIFSIYLLRKNRPFDIIWEIIKITLIIILIIVTAGQIMRWIKKLF